jgi:PPOX class probable F420-dependent enzyme
MQQMTDKEYRSFMLDTVRTGKLATVRDDGRPHVAPIWYTLDGDDLIFMTGEDTVKGENIKRDPRVAISVDEETPPFAFVLFEGEAEILDPTQEELIKWSTQIAGRYMGADKAESFGKRNAVPGELLLRIKPTKVIARKNVSD